METSPNTFNGSIAANYDHYLGPLLFESYAQDLVDRMRDAEASHLLELACGTGVVTRQLAAHLPPSAQLTATDLNEGMLAVAQEKIASSNVSWDTVDMCTIPYEDGIFDAVVCQFGLMFASDPSRALAEMYRVLAKGGKVFFNVWGEMEENPIWRIYSNLLAEHFPNAPINPTRTLFSLADQNYVLSLLQQAGFLFRQANWVTKTAVGVSAAEAAIGLVLGSPVYNFIKNDPGAVERFRRGLEEAFISELGDRPVRSGLRAWVFTAQK